MAEALDPAANIYQGVWINWSKGKVLGLTWTLCPTQATLLTNSLALFVTLAGGQLWTIVRFILHQRRAHPFPGEEDQQAPEQQLILRNAGTDLHTMRLMALLAWRSRQHGSYGPYRYAISIAFLAVLHYIVFVVAGTLSNNLVNAGTGETFNKLNASSAVLSRSPACGFWEPTYLSKIVDGPFLQVETPRTVKMSIDQNAKVDSDVELSLAYAQECYQSNFPYWMSSKCNTMKRPKLSSNKTTTTVCPFAKEICHSTSSTVIFETDPIDSHDDLGINAPAWERLRYRRRTKCAALNQTDRIVEFNKGTPEAIAFAYYGNYLAGDEPMNYTYSYSNFSSLYTDFTAVTMTPYQINTQAAFAPDPESIYASLFSPIPELQQKEADVFLFFLSYNGRYIEPIEDPWFAATIPLHVDIPVKFAQTQFLRNSMISTLGCTEQHQFCNSRGNCTPFAGWYQIQENTSFSATLTPHQNVTFDRMLRSVQLSSMAQVVNSLQATKTPLLAMAKAAISSGTVSLKLPDNQWQFELEHWHNTSMAQLQRQMVEWATGQIAVDPETQLIRAKHGPDAWFCRNLIVPSTVYQSFSVLWLTIILAIGTLVILTSWTIEEIPSRVQFRSEKMSALRRIWDRDHILGLQRKRYTRSWVPPLLLPRSRALRFRISYHLHKWA